MLATVFSRVPFPEKEPEQRNTFSLLLAIALARQAGGRLANIHYRGCSSWNLEFRIDAHRAGSASDYLLRLLYVVRVQIFHFLFSYLLELLIRKFADFALRLLGTLFHLKFLQNEARRRRD